jgi:superfamily II DNA or RNA helicase
MDIYDLELSEKSYRASQPNNINIPLKAHQLTALYKAVEMEKKGVLNYNIKNNELYNNSNITISTNVGIIGDIVGYGKTLLALSIISANKLDNIHINDICIKSFNSSIVYSYFSIKYNNYVLNSFNNIINSTLIVVPRGPVYVQWENTITRNTNLKCIAIDNLKFIKNFLPKNTEEIVDFLNSYDIVLIKNTTLKILIDYYGSNVKNWKRIMIDEAHDIINKIPYMKYHYLWLISATYTEIPRRLTNISCNTMGYILRDYVIDEYLNFILIKNEKNFIKNSFKVPIPIEKYYTCKLNVNISAIKTFISPSILEKINVNDIDGAIRELGGKNDNEDNIVELVCKELNRELSNKEIEKRYLEDLDIPIENKNLRLKNINIEIDTQKEKIKDLKERITELTKKTCSICLDFYNNPIILDCTHIYCGSCLINWLRFNKNCPNCRKIISPSKIISINNKKNNEEQNENLKSKEDTFIDIIKDKPNGKFLVFSRIESGFEKIIIKMNQIGVKYDFLKGNTSQMMNTLNKFKNGDISVILLNTQYAGSGIDINFATDVIIFHSMGIDKQQAVGRAQRVGRTEQLYIHNLCYEHELNQS